MAVTKANQLRVKCLFSSSPPMQKVYEASGATFGANDLLLETSGCVSIAATDNAVNVVGVACSPGQNATADAGATNHMIPMAPGVMLEVPIAGAANTTIALASSYMFMGGELLRADTGAWYFSSGTANWYVVGFRDAIGTVHGVVYVRPSTLGGHPAWEM